MARSQELARLFQQPDSPAQRHYEICRAYFHESAPADEIAQRFHLHCRLRPSHRPRLRSRPRRQLASSPPRRPGRKTSPKRDAIHERACELRRQGATLADIRAALQREGFDVSESYLFRLLRRAGLAATRQRRPTPQPGEYANDGSVVPDIADVRVLVPRGRTAIPDQGRRPLPVPSPVAGPRPAPGRQPREVARLGADPAAAGAARVAGPQTARQAARQSYQRSVLMTKAPGCSRASTSCPRPPTRPTIPTRPSGP